VPFCPHDCLEMQGVSSDAGLENRRLSVSL
jgi:hypothetical protein